METPIPHVHEISIFSQLEWSSGNLAETWSASMAAFDTHHHMSCVLQVMLRTFLYSTCVHGRSTITLKTCKQMFTSFTILCYPSIIWTPGKSSSMLQNRMNSCEIQSMPYDNNVCLKQQTPVNAWSETYETP